MKKIIALMLTLLMATSIAACNNQNSENSKAETVSTTVSSESSADNSSGADNADGKLDWVDFKIYNLEEDVPVKNIILMIGDGMGKNIIKASEIVKGDKLVMSGMDYTTTVTTYSQSVADGYAEYTDSAASATALSTGVKTKNGYIGIDSDGNDLETICEYAEKLDMKTGLVARQVMSHATPAGMIAHNNSRSNYPQILREMINSDVDVLFGGGAQYEKTNKKVQKAIEDSERKLITTEEEMNSLTKEDGEVLGLFAYDNMGSASMKPLLSDMTKKAIELLDNDDGFFLMVEGSNIDTYEHNSDMEQTLEQMKGFDQAVDYVLSWAEKNPGTLVLVTADHETGGVKLPENATAEDINNDCFTSDGNHTNSNVALMASGAQASEICKDDLIDNTDIAKYMREVLAESHKG